MSLPSIKSYPACTRACGATRVPHSRVCGVGLQRKARVGEGGDGHEALGPITPELLLGSTPTGQKAGWAVLDTEGLFA